MTATATPASLRRFSTASRRRKWRRWYGRGVIVGIVVVALLGGGTYLALGTDALVVKTVKVDGVRDLPASAVRAAARVPVGTAMVRLDRGAVRDRVLAALPAVATVSVERAWPSTVRLVVHERAVAVAVPQDGHYVLVDKAGVDYRNTATIPPGTVILRVRAPYSRDAATTAALSVLAGLPPDLRKLLVQVDAPTAEQIALTLNNKKRIEWGGADDGATKAAIVKVLMTRPGKVIDVTAPGLATVR